MKNLELWHEHAERGALETAAADAAIESDAAVAMAHVTVDSSRLHANANESGFANNDGQAMIPCVVTLYQSGKLSCQRQTASPSSSSLLWQVDLNTAVLEQGDDDDDDDDQSPPTPETDWFQVQVIPTSLVAVDDDDQSGSDNKINLQLCCLGRRQGVIVTLSLEGKKLELVGAFEQGILDAAWSHDGNNNTGNLDHSILALVVTQDDEDDDENDNNNDTPQQQHVMLLTMTQDFQVLQEVVLETIPAADDDSTNNKQQSLLFCPENVSLCWRPDGKWLAVLLPSLQQQMMVVRIWDPLSLSTTQPNLGRTEDGSGKLLPQLGYMVTKDDDSNDVATAPRVRKDLAWANETCSLLLACSQHVVTAKKTTTKIVLMEPNGLQHGGFSLPKTKTRQVLVQMAWALPPDNFNLLALHVRQHQTNPDGSHQILQDKVQVWHRSNYHWYLKQEFIHDGTTAILTQLQWDTPSASNSHHPTPPRQVLTALLQNGTRWYYEMGWNETVVPSQTNTAMVVDGTVLKCTPLGRTLVPPPMAAATVDLPHVVRHVALVPTTALQKQQQQQHGVVALVQMSTQALVVLGKPPSPSSKGRYKPPVILSALEPSVLRFHNFVVTGVESLVSGLRIDFVAVETTESISQPQHLLELSLSLTAEEEEDQSQFTSSKLECTASIPIPQDDDERGRVLAMTQWQSPVSNSSTDIAAPKKPVSVLVELDNGALYQYTSNAEDANSGTLQRFLCEGMMDTLLEPCPWIVGVERQRPQHDNGGGEENDFADDETEQIVIGMSWQKRLYCGDVLLADSITSFYVSDRFLCYATTATTTTATTSAVARGAASGASQLKFIALSQLFSLDPFMGASDENNAVVAADYEPRNVERGSRIVSVLRNKPMVILQLPRGNLEGVAPRALVLPHVLQQVITNRNYKVALEMMRQQKVDLNLLVDWNPGEFLSQGAEELLKQVTNVDHLNLFISSLRNENVTQTRHFLPDWFREEFGLPSSSDATSAFDFSTKVNQVCQKLRSIISDKARVGQALLLPVLSTFAKEDPPQLEAALSLIQQKAVEEDEHSRNRNKKPPLFSERAQSSIQYLAFLANYNLLFDTALGMYELDLARAVARNSQMDPKMYLPLLKQYREFPQFYSCYEIDMRLKRYPEALRNMVKSIQAQEEMQSATEVSAEGDSAPGREESGKLANSFHDALTLIKKQKLHRLGLELFHEKGQQREILLDLGDHLLNAGEAENALTIFLTMSEPMPSEQILRAAKKCQDWRTYLSYLLSTTETNDDDVQAKAREVAQEMASSVTAADLTRKRRVLSDAALILLDYCNDPSEAVDLFIQSELWSEGQRVAMLHGDPTLAQKCVDAAIAHAHATIEALPDRATTFVSTMERYSEVLKIRKEAYARGESELPGVSPMNDDAGSLFSAASQASHLTGASATSASSTGSSASYSSVISVSSTASSAFSLTGSEQTYRHKSKYNQIGQKVHKNQKRKKKKKKPKPNRVIPGSEKELETLQESLGILCLDASFMTSVSECIVFLIRSGQITVASDLYETYQSSLKKMRDCQESRMKKSREAREQQEQVNRREGIRPNAAEELLLSFVHPLETKVDNLVFEVLPSSVHRLFEYLPQELIQEDGY